ncbi:LOW QUALITY PROTEIN: hypothetical protein CFOL_v3_17858, partial [Cephalotus follicularis]
MAQNLKQKILACLTKLSDRDTYTIAAAELNSIAQSLDPTTPELSTFIQCILSTDSSDKSAARKHCIFLISLLSEVHGDGISPYVTKILSHITRRLRDPDSSTRSACVSAVSSLSSNVTKLPLAAFLKPLSEALFTEQDANAQIGAALCLAAAIDGSPDPDPAGLGRMVPRLEKLMRSEGFRGKAGVLVVVGSVIGSGSCSGHGGGWWRSLVNCLVGFLSNEDWAARKAAAEALGRLAVVERDAMAEFKAGCLKVFESRRFDKVKAVREVMNQMMEAWKQVPDLEEPSPPPPPKSVASSKEDGRDGRCLIESKNSCTPVSVSTLMRKKPIAGIRSSPEGFATTSRKGSLLKSGIARKTTPAISQRKSVDWKVEIAVPNAGNLTGVCGNDLNERGENIIETAYKRPETKRELFGKNFEDKMHKFGGLRSGSRVAPCYAESLQSTILVSNATENIHENHKESEDLSLIRNQLVQIEKQQSNLLDLLQRFMGSSQNGMRSLETRVHGLEIALDEISYDLAVSSGRMSDSHGSTCCLLPGADFLSSKFWKKSEGRYTTSRLPASRATPLLTARHYGVDANGNAETFKLENHGLGLRVGGGLIVNPLAEIRRDSRGLSEVAHQ